MIFFSDLAPKGSGSAGGTTWSHNKGGYYIKSRSAPTNPNSSRQQSTRNAMGQYATAWTAWLTQAQRDQWNTYAQNHTIKNALGQDIYINGICWFIMFNSRLFDAGHAPIGAPPAGAVPGGLATFSCDISALTTVDVTFTPALGATLLMQLWMTLPGTSGQTPNFKQARLVGYSDKAQASPWAATMPFGVTSGEQCTFFGAIMNEDGQVSTFLTHTDLSDY